MKLRVEYFFDDETKRWDFTVPALGIVGGGGTREDAEARAIDAVTFTLEGTDDGDREAMDVGYLDVEVRPAAGTLGSARRLSPQS